MILLPTHHGFVKYIILSSSSKTVEIGKGASSPAAQTVEDH